MVDIYRDPLLTPVETATHLQIPQTTLYWWLREEAAGVPLVHRVESEKRGQPSVPFVAVIEAYVLRTLRDLGLRKSVIREYAATVRDRFGTPYGLATERIATDGIDIFTEYTDGLVRFPDRQQAIREVLDNNLRYIGWEADGTPARLRLRQYPDSAVVIIDPRFGWGAPVVEQNRVRVDAVVSMWRAGETMQTVADEYGMSRDQVEVICREVGRTATA